MTDLIAREGLVGVIGRYLAAHRKRKAWELVARGMAMHPPIAREIAAMTAKHIATTGATDER